MKRYSPQTALPVSSRVVDAFPVVGTDIAEFAGYEGEVVQLRE
jgi:hypothetical protein